MKKPTFMFGLALSVAVFGTAGCALLSKSDVVKTRYFSPEVVRPGLAGADAASGPAPGPPAQSNAVAVRLGRVSSGPNLRERIAYRDDAYELGYYDDWRWTERPETFVRRALGRTLFEAHGLRRVLGGSAPTLEVEVLAFDDLRLGTSRAARVQLKVILFEDTGVVFEDTITVDRPAPADKPKIEDVVAAMTVALDIASEQVAARVGTELGRRRAAATK
jgi:cholesterol transport system auxiliary component